jgi:hypothetical protein
MFGVLAVSSRGAKRLDPRPRYQCEQRQKWIDCFRVGHTSTTFLDLPALPRRKGRWKDTPHSGVTTFGDELTQTNGT